MPGHPQERQGLYPFGLRHKDPTASQRYHKIKGLVNQELPTFRKQALSDPHPMTQCLQPHNAVTIFLMCMLYILYKALHRGLVSLFSMPTQRQSFCAPPHLPNKSLLCGLWHGAILVGFLGPDCIETLSPQNLSQRTCTVHVMAVTAPRTLLRCGKTQFSQTHCFLGAL